MDDPTDASGAHDDDPGPDTDTGKSAAGLDAGVAEARTAFTDLTRSLPNVFPKVWTAVPPAAMVALLNVHRRMPDTAIEKFLNNHRAPSPKKPNVMTARHVLRDLAPIPFT